MSFADFAAYGIPVVSALVGWGTNVLALHMTFEPIEPWGRPPWFGWQGIIPANAVRMALGGGAALGVLVGLAQASFLS